MSSKLVACTFGFLWALGHGLPQVATSLTFNEPKFDLVKNAVSSTTTSAISSATPLLQNFAVYPPVTTPADDDCTVLLMDYHFAYSYGAPYVGTYTPPNCKFNRVSMNFTVTSSGRQFDRLALMYFNDTEVWRTSTAEPTTNGIVWTYVKDMTEYMYFWNSSQKLIFDLGNIVSSTYTGIFNTTLTATFFTAQETADSADLILPVSARQGNNNKGSVYMIPSANATNTFTIPRNVNRAVFAVSANGQSTEEFWWANVLQSDVESFQAVDGTLYGFSPFREVQVFIDGDLAGVQWPFPVIFTGGVVPGLWRPIAGIDTFDLREHEIDITPWLGVLCNGEEHTFEIKVAGVLDDGEGSGVLTETVGASWYVTGKLFLWLDSNSKSITTGAKPLALLPAPTIKTSQKLTTDSTGANETLEYTIDVTRDMSVSSLIKSQAGVGLQTWTQALSATNYGKYTQYGAVQQNNQTTHGKDVSTGRTPYASTYTYPLYALSTYLVQPDGTDFTLDAQLIQGNDLVITGSSVFPNGLQPFSNISSASSLVSGLSGTSLSTTLEGTAHYLSGPGGSSGYGSTSQVMKFYGLSATNNAIDTELYYRSVAAVNTTVVSDVEKLAGKETSFTFNGALPKTQGVFGISSSKEATGRGLGSVKEDLISSGH
ncbi:peptide N-acetyl-beta-D-glucosaminyl asparaginase amidase A-domain-containing protein [Calycina marina]|uniref:Peptide N-acetyl-beta-D-glucosaminyl asparaginase amidase A-domain-containing protein n=1 Tax=Calycina marina TaxID=1763456 RepID=A0A9P7Z6G1_9HELO|nr:peptide N-acetyl-beta-D-glucosaminyl asparaginase amidase A-domain-containing protein [Calycina marina]